MKNQRWSPFAQIKRVNYNDSFIFMHTSCGTNVLPQKPSPSNKLFEFGFVHYRKAFRVCGILIDRLQIKNLENNSHSV